MNTFLNTNDERNIGICNRIIHKVMIILFDIHQKNINYLLQLKKIACKLEFSDHLWLPFIDQPQSDIVVFAMITFQIYNILVTKWKQGISPNDMITLNEEVEFLST